MMTMSDVERFELPAKFVDLAKRRTAFLFKVMQYESQSLHNILASAYVQGMSDAIKAKSNE